MNTTYYIGRNGQKYGPYSTAQLAAWLASGEVQPNEMVLAAGGARWQPASSVPELASTALPTTDAARAGRDDQQPLPLWLLGSVAALAIATVVGLIVAAVLVRDREPVSQASVHSEGENDGKRPTTKTPPKASPTPKKEPDAPATPKKPIEPPDKTDKQDVVFPITPTMIENVLGKRERQEGERSLSYIERLSVQIDKFSLNVHVRTNAGGRSLATKLFASDLRYCRMLWMNS